MTWMLSKTQYSESQSPVPSALWEWVNGCKWVGIIPEKLWEIKYTYVVIEAASSCLANYECICCQLGTLYLSIVWVTDHGSCCKSGRMYNISALASSAYIDPCIVHNIGWSMFPVSSQMQVWPSSLPDQQRSSSVYPVKPTDTRYKVPKGRTWSVAVCRQDARAQFNYSMDLNRISVRCTMESGARKNITLRKSQACAELLWVVVDMNFINHWGRASNSAQPSSSHAERMDEVDAAYYESTRLLCFLTLRNLQVFSIGEDVIGKDQRQVVFALGLHTRSTFISILWGARARPDLMIYGPAFWETAHFEASNQLAGSVQEVDLSFFLKCHVLTALGSSPNPSSLLSTCTTTTRFPKGCEMWMIRGYR